MEALWATNWCGRRAHGVVTPRNESVMRTFARTWVRYGRRYGAGGQCPHGAVTPKNERAKEATKRAKDATMSAKDATMCAKDAT